MQQKIVLIATGTMNAGGAESLIMEMLRRKSDRVYYIMLIHYANNKEKGVYDDEIKQLNIPVYYVHSVGSIGEKRYTKEFCDVIKQIGRVDIIHSHLNAVSGIISKAAKKAGIQHRIVHCHADITFKGSRFSVMANELKLYYLKKFVKKYATERWACSKAAAIRLFDTDKNTVIIPNVIHTVDYLPDEKKKTTAKQKFMLKDKFVIGSVGRIAKIKNYELVVDILSQLKNRNISAEFICFGRIAEQDYYDEIIARAKRLNVEKQLHFVGNSTDVASDIHCIDVFLMPSHSEGFGMAALEAQAAGIPTIVSTGVPTIIDVGLGAISFCPADHAELWADNILQMKNLIIEKNRIIPQFEAHGYNSETSVKQIEDIYLSLTNK